MRLTLLRHGRADWPAGRYTDADRPLDAVGLREASSAGAALADFEPPPSLLLHSPALRTAQTAALVRRALGDPSLRVIADQRLYLASAQRVCAVLDDWAREVQHVVVIGHNPGLSDLASHLPGGSGRTLSTGHWASTQLWADSRSFSASLLPR